MSDNNGAAEMTNETNTTSDAFTGQLVEIDGHTYGLRPGAARVVREALLDARRYKWLRDTPGVSWDELTDGGVSMWVGDAFAIRAPSLDAAIDAAMANGEAVRVEGTVMQQTED